MLNVTLFFITPRRRYNLSPLKVLVSIKLRPGKDILFSALFVLYESNIWCTFSQNEYLMVLLFPFVLKIVHLWCDIDIPTNCIILDNIRSWRFKWKYLQETENQKARKVDETERYNNINLSFGRWEVLHWSNIDSGWRILNRWNIYFTFHWVHHKFYMFYVYWAGYYNTDNGNIILSW